MAMDRRQVVRHWVLVPAFAGSNPAGLATRKKKPARVCFVLVIISGRIRAQGSHPERSEGFPHPAGLAKRKKDL